MLALLVLLPLALLEVVSPLADVGALAVRVRAADRRLAALARTTPLQLVGSCCGSTPAWTAALASALYREPGSREAARAALAAAVPRRA